MDRKQLDNYFMSIKNYQWISLFDANILNQEYLMTHDQELRNKIVLGVQHFIFTTLNSLNIKLDGTVIDTNDVIQYFNEYIIRGIDNGIFVNKCSLDEIFDKGFFNGLFKYIINPDYAHIQDYKDVADKDLYEGVENKLMYKGLLETLYNDTLLITSDMYERYFFNTPGDERIRTQDVFFTNSLSKGMLFKVLRSHPKYKSFKDEVKRI